MQNINTYSNKIRYNSDSRGRYLYIGWLKPIWRQSGEANLVIWRAVQSVAIWHIQIWTIWRQLQSGVKLHLAHRKGRLAMSRHCQISRPQIGTRLESPIRQSGHRAQNQHESATCDWHCVTSVSRTS